jgi:23S rRNA (cytosine1962-C5)-methyltransferase
MPNPTLRLLKHHDRRLRAGHCWVYSNEVDVAVTPLRGLAPGEPVEIEDHGGKWLGHGYANPNSLICARLVSRDKAHPLDRSLLVHRLNIALGLRDRLFPAPYYRLVFGESDGLPGLVVDRFGDVLAVQLTTAGMERLKDDVLAALDKVLRPKAVLWRNDVGVRALEGLPLYVEEALGQAPLMQEVQEQGVGFRFPLLGGQKTGWYFDQADNRGRLLRYVAGKRVLDVCSYVGGWGVRAARGGAAQVLCVDSSAQALELATENAGRNGVGERLATLQGDAFEVLRQLREERERFDVVLLDPPAFIKRRKDLEQGILAYRRLNQLGLRLLSKDGILVSSSCSHHMGEPQLLEEIQGAARHTDRSLQLLERGQQAPDHPILPAMPETAYLKTFYLRSLPTF